jgi:all-trans-retinol 13,14-reductase
MQKYDDIVVGAGISGMTLAALLAANKRRVLLLEKAGHVGGSLSRFWRQGVPFDTGFHFTGGFGPGGILQEMLDVLGMSDRIQPVYFAAKESNRCVFEEESASFYLPLGLTNTIVGLKQYFPAESAGIDKYFELIRTVCAKTLPMDLRKIAETPDIIDQDYVSFQSVLDELFTDKLLKGLLSIYCSCYGTRPAEVSFANHSRVVFNFHESVARVKDGGDAFIRGFKDNLEQAGVDILCGRYIAECVDVEHDKVGTFVLDDGSCVKSDFCTFTIHPQKILKTLPAKHLSKAFIERVSEFESSLGFFSLFGVLKEPIPQDDAAPSITSLFPCSDVNKLLDRDYNGRPALVVMTSDESSSAGTFRAVSALAVSFAGQMKQWQGTSVGSRPVEYYQYKSRLTEDIYQRIIEAFPKYKESFKVLDSASPLTFRDYLNSPDGSAYGIKQKLGQFNLFGKLPLRNLYVCGQSSVLPGLVGAMMSAFVVARALVGKEEYSRFIEGKLCRQDA